MRHLIFGQQGEKLALEYLKKHGVIIITKNFKNRFGEIDLIGKDNEQIVFFEVKRSKDIRFGFPEERVNAVKLNKIIKTGQGFLIQNNLIDNSWRIDVVSIQDKQIKWIKNITN